jgi:hypothetical protein
MACLDRYFVNTVLVSQYPTSHSMSFPRLCSDHSPICFEFGPSTKCKSTIFHFEKYWLSHEGFSNQLALWWQQFHLNNNKALD